MENKVLILMVDDYQDLMTGMKEFFHFLIKRGERIECLWADSVDRALALLQDNPAISVLITDVVVPGPFDGIGLVKHVRHHFPNVIHQFVMTAYPEREKEIEDLGVSSWWRKRGKLKFQHWVTNEVLPTIYNG